MTKLADRLAYRLAGGNRFGFNAFYLAPTWARGSSPRSTWMSSCTTIAIGRSGAGHRAAVAAELEDLNAAWATAHCAAGRSQQHFMSSLMSSHGAQTLQARLEQQAHWRQAPAVQRGDQSATDPDAWELEELREGLRLYNVREQHREVVDGRPALVIQRLTKRLVDGRWERFYDVEKVRPL